MPVATTTPAGRTAHDAHVARMADAKAKRDAAQAAADTLTPLETVGAVPLETLFPDEQPAPAKAARTITMQISAVMDGFTVLISFDGRVEQLPGAIERLRAMGATPTTSAPAAPLATPDDLPDGWKLCQKHHAPMRPRNKQNANWHSHNVGTKDAPLWCKGYRGADSPGYEVE